MTGDYSPKNVALGILFTALCFGAFVGYAFLLMATANAHSLWFPVLFVGPLVLLLAVMLVQGFVAWYSDR